jgi:hypothetical protein
MRAVSVKCFIKQRVYTYDMLRELDSRVSAGNNCIVQVHSLILCHLLFLRQFLGWHGCSVVDVQFAFNGPRFWVEKVWRFKVGKALDVDFVLVLSEPPLVNCRRC